MLKVKVWSTDQVRVLSEIKIKVQCGVDRVGAQSRSRVMFRLKQGQDCIGSRGREQEEGSGSDRGSVTILTTCSCVLCP